MNQSMNQSMKQRLSIATLNMTTNASAATDVMDDVALMARIAIGDRGAFELFLSNHLTAVVQFARRYLSNQADAEDIAQETFFRVWKKAGSWQPQGHSPRSWVYRIAYNLCIDEIRRRPALASSSEHEMHATSDSTETMIETESNIQQLTRSLEDLPDRQHTAISLCALQGLTNKEAASAMDISIEALESLLSRGRRLLRSRMQKDGESDHE
jgi:RNA polymerase sigma-70 factor (ECF subfamily)